MPAIYAVLNGKYELFYQIVFESILNIITCNKTILFDIDIIITDFEDA